MEALSNAYLWLPPLCHFMVIDIYLEQKHKGEPPFITQYSGGFRRSSQRVGTQYAKILLYRTQAENNYIKGANVNKTDDNSHM